MFERVLVPTDGSPRMDELVERAVALGDPDRTEIHSLYVIDHRALLPLNEEEQQSVADSLKDRGETAVQTLSDAVDDQAPGFEMSEFVAQGIPARQIIAYAQEHDMDAIVLGSHGQTMRAQAVGSTTEQVVQGIANLDDTTLVIVPIGDEDEREAHEQEMTKQAEGMFQ